MTGALGVQRGVRSARWKAERVRLEAEKVDQNLRNMSRERLLPSEKTLEKVARYKPISPEGFTRLSTSLRLCRPGTQVR
jgi:hypothetical protein